MCLQRHNPTNLIKMENPRRDQFMRIAMARLFTEYPFEPQRLAIASKMYARWIERKNEIRRQEEERKKHLMRILKKRKNG